MNELKRNLPRPFTVNHPRSSAASRADTATMPMGDRVGESWAVGTNEVHSGSPASCRRTGVHAGEDVKSEAMGIAWAPFASQIP